MRENLLVGTVVLAGFAVTVAAQSSSGLSQSAAESAAAQARQGEPMTYTGCLQNVNRAAEAVPAVTRGGAKPGSSGTPPQGATSTPPTGGKSGDPTAIAARFVLIAGEPDGRPHRDDDSQSSATSGTTGTTAAKDPLRNPRFLLVGGNQEELQGLLNSQVEIRGTLQPGGRSPQQAAPGKAGARNVTDPHATPPQTIRVTSVKQIATSC